MHRLIAAVLIPSLALSAGCAPLLSAAGPSVEPAETFTPILISPTGPPTKSPAASPEPFALELTPLPTPTALATLTLPTQPAFPQEMQVWDGLPTYPAESRPGFDFRVRYDPAAWALTTDQFGFPVLGSRTMAGCVLTPAQGRGLPLSGSVDHEVRQVGGVTFQVSSAFEGGVMKFVNYAGGDGVIFTAFEVSFQDQAEACLAAAEGVLGTLSSIPLQEATPVPG